MDPCGRDGLEPWAFRGQPTGHQADTMSRAFDRLLVSSPPGTDRVAFGPRGMIPDQQPRRAPRRRPPLTAPGQEVDGDGTDGTVLNTAQHYLPRRGGVMADQETITRQRLRIALCLGAGPLLQAQRTRGVPPALLLGLGQPTPPSLVAPVQGPGRMTTGQADQPVALVFFRTYAGSGLVIQGLARFQRTPLEARVVRMVSPLTRRGVSPWAQLTSAPRSSVQQLVAVSQGRGRWWNNARRRSRPGASNVAWVVCGRDDWGWRAARSYAWQAWSAWHPVWSLPCRARAIAVVGCPAALARSRWHRRTVQPAAERSPASKAARSSAVSGRTKSGVCLRQSLPHAL
jgi:hypothetical protein